MTLSPEDVARRIAAKRNNERIKLIATALNATAIAIIAAAVIVVASPAFLLTTKPWILLLVAFAYI